MKRAGQPKGGDRRRPPFAPQDRSSKQCRISRALAQPISNKVQRYDVKSL